MRAAAAPAMLIVRAERGATHAADPWPPSRSSRPRHQHAYCGWRLWLWPDGATNHEPLPAGTPVTCGICRSTAAYRRAIAQGRS